MEQTITSIAWHNLAFAFIPVALVFFIFAKWSLSSKRLMLAITRMLVQLLLIGYFLVFIFESNNVWLVILILVIMVLFSSWIALGNLPVKTALLKSAIMSISLSGIFTLVIISQGVLELSPWYQAQTLLPLAGMIFASSMNSISLSGERFFAELAKGTCYQEARNVAFQTSMIPNINALLAVGIVSLPGMMTGQILSGVSPFIAARYQIMVMCMIFAAAGIAAAIFLRLIKDQPFQQKTKSNGG